MKKPNKFLGISMGMALILVLALGAIQSNKTVPNGEEVRYYSNVCAYKNNVLIDCNSNVVTNTGKDFIKTSIGQEASNNVSELAIGNGTTPVVASTSLDGEKTANGLERVNGTYYNNGVGNWSIVYTWTSTADAQVLNTTGLYAIGGNLFAGTTFTETTLQTDDQITINYTISVS